MSNVLTLLENEDIVRSQRFDARSKAIAQIPTAFGPEKIEEHYMRMYAFNLEMTRKYNLPLDGGWYIDSDTGAVVKEEN